MGLAGPIIKQDAEVSKVNLVIVVQISYGAARVPIEKQNRKINKVGLAIVVQIRLGTLPRRLVTNIESKALTIIA